MKFLLENVLFDVKMAAQCRVDSRTYTMEMELLNIKSIYSSKSQRDREFEILAKNSKPFLYRAGKPQDRSVG